MFKVYYALVNSYDRIYSMVEELAFRGYKKCITYALDELMTKCIGKRVEFNLWTGVRDTIFIGLCRGKHFNMLNMCGRVSSDILYQGTIAVNNYVDIEKILKSYQFVNSLELYGIALNNNNNMLMDVLILVEEPNPYLY
jgi:hypothetical protein